MPITLRPNDVNYKDGNSYKTMNVIADQKTSEKIAAIEAAAPAEVTKITEKGTETRNSIPDNYTALSDQVVGLKSDYAQLDEAMSDVIRYSATDFDKLISEGFATTMQSGIMYANGSTGNSAYAYYTDKIQVQTGDVITLSNAYYIKNGLKMYSSNASKIGSLTAFSDDIVVTSAGKTWNANLESYTVPDGITQVVVTATRGSATFTHIDINIHRESGFGKESIIVERKWGKPFAFVGDMASNEPVYLPFENVWMDKTWMFDGLIDSIGTLKIGNYDEASGSIVEPYIEITSTHVDVHSALSGEQFQRHMPHSLNIANDLQVIVEHGQSLFVQKIIVQSNGERWVCDDNTIRFGENKTGIAAVSSVNVSSASLSVGIKNINKDVWVFGDSYQSLYDDRWSKQAIDLGYGKDWLFSGYAGETTQNGLISFENLIAIQQPKIALWLYGMNNEENGAQGPQRYQAWQDATERFLALCDKYDIVPVLYIVPTTQARVHTQKEAWVRASGRRYVDGVAAFGADSNGNWIGGYLASDNIHTTVAGAKALMMRIMADVPEMFN